MSVDVDFFFNMEGSPQDVAEQINDVLNCQLSPLDDPDSFGCSFFGMNIHLLAHHGCLNDGQLDFERYRFLLGTTTYWGQSRLRTLQVDVLAMAVHLLLEQMAIGSGILTYELSTLLAEYHVEQGVPYDRLAKKQVMFPEHLYDLAHRL
ncbi:MAG: hypothetical protein RhofKO_37000 [Rhodothermales bacterium]